MERITFYDAGPIITRATLWGFCHDDSSDMCTHTSCGFKKPYRVCPKCGRHHGVYAHDYSGSSDQTASDYNPNYGKKLKTRECTPKKESWHAWEPCSFNIEKAPIKDGKKVKCKMVRFRSYTTEELANPATDIRYALIEVEFAATQGEHLFVADLKNIDFINREMTINQTKKGWSVYNGSFSDPIDISKIANKADVIKQIGKIFSRH